MQIGIQQAFKEQEAKKFVSNRLRSMFIILLTPASQSQKDLNNLLFEWIVSTDQPYSVLDEKPFRDLLAGLIGARSLEIPGEKFARLRLPKEAEAARNAIRKVLQVRGVLEQ
jgi:hypothetical protein